MHPIASKLVPPSQRRPGIWRNGVLQIWTTRACDKKCFGCTQGSNLRGPYPRITPEQFEAACISLAGYWGVVGVFGGNPCTHPEFAELCEILKAHIPWEQRGLWTNKLFGHGKLVRETFNADVSNVNVHLDKEAYAEFAQDWPEARVMGLTEDSRHSPPFVAMRDIIPDENERWQRIDGCDINKHWSALIGVFRGELRAWFCEIAGAQSMLKQSDPDYPDTGVEVSPGWWRAPIEAYENQIVKHCHDCSVPLRGYGALAISGPKEQTSETYADIYLPKEKNRPVEIVTDETQLQSNSLERVTDYVQNGKK